MTAPKSSQGTWTLLPAIAYYCGYTATVLLHPAWIVGEAKATNEKAAPKAAFLIPRVSAKPQRE